MVISDGAAGHKSRERSMKAMSCFVILTAPRSVYCEVTFLIVDDRTLQYFISVKLQY